MNLMIYQMMHTAAVCDIILGMVHIKYFKALIVHLNLISRSFAQSISFSSLTEAEASFNIIIMLRKFP